MQIQCSCCGAKKSFQYSVGNVLSKVTGAGWNSFGHALYCPKCSKTWEERNGSDRPLAGPEKERKGSKLFPLDTWGMTEADCLRYCYERGYTWEENAGAGVVRLYDVLDRVSCWCCANKNLRELRNMRRLLPEYWAKLEDLQRRTDRPMKGVGKSVFELGKRFEREGT